MPLLPNDAADGAIAPDRDGLMPREVVLFGTGSAISADYAATCRRLKITVAAGVADRDGPGFLPPEVSVVGREGLGSDLLGIACLCPLFTPADRRTAVEEASSLGFAFPADLVDPTAIVADDLGLGGGCFVDVGVVIGACARLGRHVVVSRAVSIGPHVSIGDFVSLGPGAVLGRDVSVAAGAMIGARAVVLPGVIIGEGAVVGDGAVVTGDVRAGARVAGPAARVVGAPPMVDGAPAVSVVIRSCNHAAHIGRTIESVLQQTLQDFEILVTDDGSADGALDVVRGFKDDRIKREFLPVDRGVSLAMTALLARATGRYVAILNSDDFAFPQRLERQVAHLEERPAEGGVFTAVQRIDEEGRPTPESDLFSLPTAWPDHARTRWLRRFFFDGDCPCASSAMLRRDVLAEIGPYDPRLTKLQDLDVWVRLARRGEIGFLPEPLTAVRTRPGLADPSALQLDTKLGSPFETAQILRRYLEMPTALLQAVFAPDLDGLVLETEAQKRRWLAEAALRADRPSHQLFGLQTLFEEARELADYDRLRKVTGEVDVLNILRSRVGPGGPPEPSADSFPEVDYLEANPDVATAVGAGIFVSGWEHWERYGRGEQRPLHAPALVS